ncbi:hypothetical protein OCK74_17450 [Chitinophagaceae bacterium LB-8]|uniref:Outer membrane protein beta-barrel domain-containing protein n=1 Tax=Paraflavisolibacter caeni TaxID=2982496 RepID=A0A9X3B8M4_9BACT|nr:hypothetical protein [Paraflavisolibacter caeni]MCU7550910.1 hypothetical protein [Paraflavisolibacter caeni]
MMKNIFSIILIACIFISSANAQESDVQDSTREKGLAFKISLNYNSGLNYYGRTDSMTSSGIFPMAELWFSPKVYINAAPVFVHNQISALEYAGSVATIGYLYSSNKWLSHLYAMKPFYKESSQLVQSALKAQTGASFSFLNKVVNITAGGDMKFSDKIDFGATAGLDHIFRMQRGQSVLVLNPSLFVNAGTQNFTRSYKKKTGGVLNRREQQVTEQIQAFNILSYEASLPLIYSKDKFQVLVTPAYVIPQNLIQLPDQPEQSEYGKNMLYTTVTVKYTFK